MEFRSIKLSILLPAIKKYFMISLLISIAITFSLSLLAAIVLPAQYKSYSQVIVEVKNNGDMSTDKFATYVNTYKYLIKNDTFLKQTMEKINLDEDISKVKNDVEIALEPNSYVISIEAKAGEKSKAYQLANAIADKMIEITNLNLKTGVINITKNSNNRDITSVKKQIILISAVFIEILSFLSVLMHRIIRDRINGKIFSFEEITERYDSPILGYIKK